VLQALQPDRFWTKGKNVYDFTVKDLDGSDVKLDKYKGKPSVITNIATNGMLSETNLKALQGLYDCYNGKLNVLGFPCNQFGSDCPESNPQIKKLIQEKNITFNVFGKINVNGPNADSLFNFLKTKQQGWVGDDLKWNFTKFLIDQNGKPIARYMPESPADIRKDIDKLLGTQAG